MAEEIVKVVKIDASNSNKTLKQLRENVKGLKKELEDTTVGTSNWVRKVRELEKAQDQLNTTTQALKGNTVNITAALDNTAKVAASLTAGLSAARAGFVLFGEDTEALDETMVKLQAAIALVQGVKGFAGIGKSIMNAVKSVKAMTIAMSATTVSTRGLSTAMAGLKTALMSTGIGALVVLLGTLVSALDKAMSSAKEAGSAKIGSDVKHSSNTRWNNDQDFKELEESIERLETNFDLLTAAGGDAVQLAKDYYEELKELYLSYFTPERNTKVYSLYLQGVLQMISDVQVNGKKAARKALEEILKEFNMSEQDLAEAIMSTGPVYDSFTDMLTSSQAQMLDSLRDDYEHYIDTQTKALETLKSLNKKAAIEEVKAETEAAKEVKDAAEKRRKEAAEAEKQHREEILKLIKEYGEEADELIMNTYFKQLLDAQTAYDTQLSTLDEALKKQYITQEQYDSLLLKLEEAFAIKKANIEKQELEETKNRLDEEIAEYEEQLSKLSQYYANKQDLLASEHNKSYETKVNGGNWVAGGYYQKRSDVNDEYNNTISFNQEKYELTKEWVDKENELLYKQLKVYQEQLDQKLISQAEFTDAYEQLAMQKELNDKALSDADNERQEKDLKAFKDRQEKKQKALTATFNVTSSLTGAVANLYKQQSQDEKKGEDARKQAFKNYKRLATTQAVIDTISSAQGAYKSMVSIPYVGPFLAAAAAAAAIVAGMANVKAIQNETLPESKEENSPAANIATSALSTSPIEYTRNLLGDKETSEVNKPIRCYVLENDITTTQNRVAVTEQNASF